jgi:hypothetical protein
VAKASRAAYWICSRLRWVASQLDRVICNALHQA